MEFSIVECISSFTLWINSSIYAIFLYFSACMKIMVVSSIKHSIGMLLTLTGYDELSFFLIEYLHAIREEYFSAFIVIFFNHVLFFWYYKKSSLNPIIRVNDLKDASENCQEKNLEIQLNEIKDKSKREAENILNVQKNYDKERLNSKNVNVENQDLKKLVKESEADKETIQKLQISIKKHEDEIEIKACALDKLQIALQSSKNDVLNSKSDFKELESKFFDVIKELDIKDVTISDFENAEKLFKKELGDKDKDILGKEEAINDMNEKIKDLEKQILDLEREIEEEKKLSQSLKLEKDVLTEALENINKINSEVDADCRDDEKVSASVVEQLKAERIGMMMNTTKIKEELKDTKHELLSCKEELRLYIKRNDDLAKKYKELNAKFEALSSKTKDLKKTIEKKDIELTTIAKFYGEKESELQTLTMSQSEEIKKLKKEVDSIGDDRRQIIELNKQVDDLKEEITSNEKQHKHRIAAIEEESHASYLKMRTANRECEEHKREKEIYRKRLLETDAHQSFKTPSSGIGSLDRSNRSDSPGSNKSNEESLESTRMPSSGQTACPPMPLRPLVYPGIRPFPPMSTPPFRMPPRLSYSGPPRPYMPLLRQRMMNNNVPYTSNNGYQHNTVSSDPTNVNGSSFNGQEYVDALIDKLATKDTVRKDLFEKKNKEMV